MSLFMELWRNAPMNYNIHNIVLDKKGKPDPVNQCAVRFSHMVLLTSLASNLSMFMDTLARRDKSRPITKGHFRYMKKAADAADWTRQRFGQPVTLGRGRDTIEEYLNGRNGIIHLDDFYGLDPGSDETLFDHIDVWRGDFETRMSVGFDRNGWFSSVRKVQFWEVK